MVIVKELVYYFSNVSKDISKDNRKTLFLFVRKNK